ncbi:hypothetical protein BJ684DRAFT_16888 [Piptocephalis cylindrospora]|uniref:Uncharacterized protein n=1 Tax=Piptocephalis cylindrospora TaxID=1907219 RepID=A0A4P9Y1J1_9FUNG|nr:hypothetical protein BJ684DRAFT_16888 [Piptocephalis cylindrospora]|eukprot:RKP12645.1 hypothetical protein BJ684DRAFT_16888 [Piptocephalis cylindrospora]
MTGSTASVLPMLKARLDLLGTETEIQGLNRRQLLLQTAPTLSSYDLSQLLRKDADPLDLTAEDVGSLILGLCPARSVEAFRLLQPYQTFPGRRSRTPYHALVYGLARTGELTKAERVLQALSADPYITKTAGAPYAVYLKELSQIKGPEFALKWWMSWCAAHLKDKSTNGMIIRNTVLSLLLKVPGNLGKSEWIRHQLSDSAKNRNTFGMNLVLRTVVKAKKEWEDRIHAVLASNSHLNWDATTYTILIDTASRHKRWDLAEAWYDKALEEDGLCPDTALLTVIVGYLLSRRLDKKATEAQIELMRMAQVPIVDAGVCRLWIRHYGARRQLSEAKRIWKMACEAGVVDTKHQMYDAMLKAFIVSDKYASWPSWLKEQQGVLGAQSALSPSSSLSRSLLSLPERGVHSAYRVSNLLNGQDWSLQMSLRSIDTAGLDGNGRMGLGMGPSQSNVQTYGF